AVRRLLVRKRDDVRGSEVAPDVLDRDIGSDASGVFPLPEALEQSAVEAMTFRVAGEDVAHHEEEGGWLGCADSVESGDEGLQTLVPLDQTEKEDHLPVARDSERFPSRLPALGFEGAEELEAPVWNHRDSRGIDVEKSEQLPLVGLGVNDD